MQPSATEGILPTSSGFSRLRSRSGCSHSFEGTKSARNVLDDRGRRCEPCQGPARRLLAVKHRQRRKRLKPNTITTGSRELPPTVTLNSREQLDCRFQTHSERTPSVIWAYLTRSVASPTSHHPGESVKNGVGRGSAIVRPGLRLSEANADCFNVSRYHQRLKKAACSVTLAPYLANHAECRQALLGWQPTAWESIRTLCCAGRIAPGRGCAVWKQ